MVYRTKQQILADMLNEANKFEQAGLWYGEQGFDKIESDLTKKATDLFQKANEYSIRWNVR